MEDIINIIVILGILSVITFLSYYAFKVYFLPQKIAGIQSMIKGGEFDLALRKLALLANKNGRDSELYYLMGFVKEMQNLPHEAIKHYQRALDINVYNNHNVQEETVRNRLGDVHLNLNNYEFAKKEFLLLTKLTSTEGKYCYKLGLILKKQNNMEKAFTYLQQAVKFDPIHGPSHLNLGIVSYALSNTAEAKGHLLQALKIDSTLAEAHYYLALCLKAQKDYEWANREFELSMKDPSFVTKAHLGIGLSYLSQNHTSSALRHFKIGLEKAQPKSQTELNLRYAMARAAELRRDIPLALQQWEYIHSINPGFRDVSQKLSSYEDFQTEDSIKDFVIATTLSFEEISKNLIELMNLKAISVDIVNTSEIHIIAAEDDSRWRNTKKNHRLVYIVRTTEVVLENTLRDMYENMKISNANRGIFMTTGAFSPGAIIFSQSRPIELIDKTILVKYLDRIK